jgi:hypothetical protein
MAFLELALQLNHEYYNRKNSNGMALHSVYTTVDCSFMISKHVPNDNVVQIKLYIYDSACGITRLKPIKMKLELSFPYHALVFGTRWVVMMSMYCTEARFPLIGTKYPVPSTEMQHLNVILAENARRGSI